MNIPKNESLSNLDQNAKIDLTEINDLPEAIYLMLALVL